MRSLVLRGRISPSCCADISRTDGLIWKVYCKLDLIWVYSGRLVHHSQRCYPSACVLSLLLSVLPLDYVHLLLIQPDESLVSMMWQFLEVNCLFCKY